MRSTAFGAPSDTLSTTFTGMPRLVSAAAVPRVAWMAKPSACSRCARMVAADLSLSHTERKTSPSVGSARPAAATALPNASGKVSAIPITSPVDLISGPSCVSVPGNRPNGRTASLTLT